MTPKVDLKLNWCSYKAAKYAVEHWHYSKRLISTYTRPVYLGVWEQGKFCGSIVFSHGVNRHIGTPYGLTQFECCELVRVALSAHFYPVSKIIAISLKLLKLQSPGLRLVVSYADANMGHYGGIYQASNWLYVGTVKGTDEFEVAGRYMHARAVDCSLGVRNGYPRRRGGIKHKYLWSFDPFLRQQLQLLAKPYPKRPASIAPDAPPDQGGEDGWQPIAGLQHNYPMEMGTSHGDVRPTGC